MSVVAGLAAVLAPWVLGIAIVRAAGLRDGRDILAAAGYSYVAGTLATGAALFCWLAARLPFSPFLLNGILIAAAVGIAVLVRARVPIAGSAIAAEPGPFERAPRWQRAVFWAAFAIAIAVVCDRALLVSLKPVNEGDEAFIWSARAKVLFHAGGLNERFQNEMLEKVNGAADVVSHTDYPLLNSLLQVLAFVDAGRITNFENRFPIQAFGLALVLIAAAGLRRSASPLIAAAMLVILVSEETTAFIFRASLADGMVALGFLCAVDCFLRSGASGDATWARLGGLSLGFLAWSKHEGAMLAALSLVFVLAMSRRRWLAWLWCPAAVVALTWAFNAWFGFRNDLVQEGMPEGTIWTRLLLPFGPRGADLGARFWRDFAGSPAASRLLLLPLVLALFHPAVRRRPPVFVAGLLVLAAVCADFWVFAATPRDFDWHWSTAGVRVLSQTNAATVLVVGAMAGAILRAGALDRLHRNVRCAPVGDPGRL